MLSGGGKKTHHSDGKYDGQCDGEGFIPEDQRIKETEEDLEIHAWHQCYNEKKKDIDAYRNSRMELYGKFRSIENDLSKARHMVDHTVRFGISQQENLIKIADREIAILDEKVKLERVRKRRMNLGSIFGKSDKKKMVEWQVKKSLAKTRIKVIKDTQKEEANRCLADVQTRYDALKLEYEDTAYLKLQLEMNEIEN